MPGAGDFVHLHVHTEYSMLDGASRVQGLVDTIAAEGMPAAAITDHGVMFGVIDYYRAARSAGINPILGSEIYMAPGSRFQKGNRRSGDEPYHHLILLAQDDVGYRNLMKLTSRAYLEGYWYKPRADKELLEEHGEGLICLSGCLGAEINQHLLAGRRAEAVAAAAWYRDVFGDRYFIELQDHDIPDQHRTNGDLIRIARDLGVGLVVTNDSHYTRQEDAEAHDALLCIQTGSLKSDADRFKFHNDQFFVKPAAQMHALFPEHPETWQNTLLIAERCNVEIDFDTMHLPRFDCPDGLDEQAYLRRLSYDGAVQRYGDPVPEEVRERLDHELGVIGQMGFPAYFLIVADLVDHAKRNGIRVGPGRGSAAGCAVAYCTGITDLDPIAHGLIFERFLNPERVSMPDIDMDFDERRRGEMIRYARERYGDDRVAQIVTYSTIKSKQAIRDAARVLGYPFGFGDRLTKMMPPPVMGKEHPLDKAREMSAELAEAWDSEPDCKRVLDTARSLEGLRRQHSIHAAGVVIGAEPIQELCPVLQVEADGEIVTQYDGGMVEALGLLKMDFLGLRNLTVISDALEHILRNTGESIVIEDVALDDQRTFKMLAEGDTDGVFQLDSAGMKALCRHLKPDRFDDIVALLALYRPGPMKADLHNEYARRKHGSSPVSYLHADLEEFLAPTYGILVYQEQVLQIAQKLAGFSLGEADLLRRAIGKKKMSEMEQQKAKFLAGGEERGYAERFLLDLWNLIEGFADYAFNKSHSAGYGLVSYQTAWLKANYPVEYMAALLTSVKNNKDRLPLYLHTCRMMGITVLQPDVNSSELDFSPVGEQIRFGLSAVRNVGEQVVEGVLAARRAGGPFVDFLDFCKRVDGNVLNKRTIESLIKAGAFESMGHPRKGLLLAFEPVVDSVLATKRAEAEGQFSLFGGMDADGGECAELEVEVVIPAIEFERKDLLAAEREMLGLYVSDHPLLGLERALADLATGPIPQLLERGAGDVVIAGLLSGLQKKFTRKGEPYVLGQLEDLQGAVEVLFFPTTYAAAIDLLVEDAVLVVRGRLDDGDPPRVVASSVAQPDLSAVTGAPLVVTVAPQQCTDEVIARLRELLVEHVGHLPVHLRLSSPDGRMTTLRLDERYGVTRSPGLYAELKALLGPDAVS